MTKEARCLRSLGQERSMYVKLKLIALMYIRQNLTMEHSICMIALFQRDYDPQLRQRTLEEQIS